MFKHQKIAIAMMAVLVSSQALAEESSEEITKDDKVTDLSAVIVVGEKAGRSHFETAASAEIFGAKQMQADGNIQSVKDLLKQTLNVVDVGSVGNDLPAVRGVDGSGPAQGAVAFLAGSRPRLNLLTDGRSASYNEFAFATQSLWDMEQIEVFKGPQSFSQGRNAIAGAIVMTSKDPSFDWEGGAKLLAGNQKSRQGSAVISGPIISDELAFRVSYDRQTRQSYVKLIDYEPVGSPRDIQTTTMRAKLLYTPSNFPEFFTRLTFNNIKSRTPQNEASTNPEGARYTPERPMFKTTSHAGIWDMDWQANDYIGFSNKVIYTKYKNNRIGVAYSQGIPATVDGKEWQIEPIMRFNNSDQSIRGLVGLFFFAGEQDESVKLFGQFNNFKDKTRTQAAYAEVTYSPVKTWDITVAGRVEKENHKRHGGSSLISVGVDKSETVFLPKVDIAWKPTENFTTGFKVSKGYNPGGAGITFDMPFVAYEYESEQVWNYELYNRIRTLDNKLEIFTNLFYNQYTDMQLPYYLSGNSVVIRNADKVDTYGAEISAKYQATQDWTINGGLSYLKTDIKKYPNSGVEGRELSRAPKFTANLGTHYKYRNWDMGGNVHWTDKYYSNYTNDNNGKISSYTQVNVYAGYTFEMAGIESARVSFYADNVFNSERLTFIPANERREAIKQRPRSIGLTAEFKF